MGAGEIGIREAVGREKEVDVDEGSKVISRDHAKAAKEREGGNNGGYSYR